MTKTTGIAVLAGPRQPHDLTDWRARHNRAWASPTNATERHIVFLVQSLAALEDVAREMDWTDRPEFYEFDYYADERIASPLINALIDTLSWGQNLSLDTGLIDQWARDYAVRHHLDGVEC